VREPGRADRPSVNAFSGAGVNRKRPTRTWAPAHRALAAPGRAGRPAASTRYEFANLNVSGLASTSGTRVVGLRSTTKVWPTVRISSRDRIDPKQPFGRTRPVVTL
jgi:hypothetical protein